MYSFELKSVGAGVSMTIPPAGTVGPMLRVRVPVDVVRLVPVSDAEPDSEPEGREAVFRSVGRRVFRVVVVSESSSLALFEAADSSALDAGVADGVADSSFSLFCRTTRESMSGSQAGQAAARGVQAARQTARAVVGFMV